MAQRKSLAKQLGELLARLPLDEYITIQLEKRDEGDIDNPFEVFLSMVLLRRAPKDGWRTEGDYFGHPLGSPRHQIPCRESWKHGNQCILGVSGDPAHPKQFLCSVIGALQKHLEGA